MSWCVADWPVASGSDVTCIGMKPWPREPQSGSTKVSGVLGANCAADEPAVEARLEVLDHEAAPPGRGEEDDGRRGAGAIIERRGIVGSGREVRMVLGR